MPFNPKFTITPKINKALVEIERVRGFLDAVKLKDDWFADMQKKALILESHHSTHIEGTALNLEQAQSILEGKRLKGGNRDDEKELLNYKKAIKYLLRTGAISVGEYQAEASCIRRTAQRDLEYLMGKGIIKAVAKSQTDPTRHYVLL